MLSITRKKIMLVSLVMLSLALLGRAFVTSQASAATAQEQVCAGLGAVDGGDGCTDPAGTSSLSNTVKNVINILSIVVGMTAIIMIVVGGLKYVTSQGDSSGVASAKNTIIYAVIGIIIVTLAQVIVRFVVARSTQESPATSTTAPGQLPVVPRN
jgi:hypothetical protein